MGQRLRARLEPAGGRVERATPLLAILQGAGVSAVTWSRPGEPTVQGVREGAALARTEKVDFIVAFGGGSAIDAGKAVAALAPNDKDLFDYLEVIGRAQPLESVNRCGPANDTIEGRTLS